MYVKIRTRENTGVDYEDKAMRRRQRVSYDELEHVNRIPVGHSFGPTPVFSKV